MDDSISYGPKLVAVIIYFCQHIISVNVKVNVYRKYVSRAETFYNIITMKRLWKRLKDH